MTRISDAIKQDHEELASIYDRIVHSPDMNERTRYQNLFVWDLARHCVGEELVVYPAYEKHVAGGKFLAEKDRRENQVLKQKLKEFQTMKPADPNFIPALRALMEDLAKHIREQENNDMVELEEAIKDHQSQSLARSLHRIKIFMPTRSHPGAPNKPPFETAVGLMTAPIDQLGDLFRKWPHSATAA